MGEQDLKITTFLKHLLKPRTIEETQEVYSEWAEKYDEEVKDIGYKGAQIAVSCFLELDCAKYSRIIDIGAGTGSVGSLLKNYGYDNIDGLDATQKMLDLAKEKNCYKNLINAIISSNTKLPIEDKTYDIVIMAGVLCPGHIKIDAFDEILRITKSGGIICWSMSATEVFEECDEQFRDQKFERIISSLCDKRKWISISGYPKQIQNYCHTRNGWFYAMQVL